MLWGVEREVFPFTRFKNHNLAMASKRGNNGQNIIYCQIAIFSTWTAEGERISGCTWSGF